MYDYIILTAAVTRPDLHSQVFPRHLELIGPSRVLWLINVDDIGSDHSVDETVSNLRRLVALPNVEAEFLTPVGAGCFLSAARRLAKRANEQLDRCRTGVLWLEDDWIQPRRSLADGALTSLRLRLARNLVGGRLLRCPGTLADKQKVLARCGNPDWFVSLVPRSRVSFNPGIWSKVLFRRALYQTLEKFPEDRVDDPETLCADPLNEPERYRRVSIFVDPLFQDAGRRWSARCGVKKWDKAAQALQHAGAVTYRPLQTFGSQPPQSILQPGWAVVPLKTPYGDVPLVARAEPVDGSLRLRPPGMPWLSLELRPSEAGKADLYLNRPHGWARTYPFKQVGGSCSWQPGGNRILVETPERSIEARLRERLPPSALIVVPLQAAVGALAWAGELVPRLRRLDAERAPA